MAEMTYREAIKQALREELQNDERVFMIGEDIAEFGGTFKVSLGLLEEFGPRRIRNTPFLRRLSWARRWVPRPPVCGRLPKSCTATSLR